MKCFKNYYSGLIRPIDRETLASEKIVCYSQFPRAEGMPRPTGPHGKSQGQLGGRSAGRGHRGVAGGGDREWARVFIPFLTGGNGPGRASRLSRFVIG